jgi:hypothetical protein
VLASPRIERRVMVQAQEREVIFCGVRWVLVQVSDLALLLSQFAIQVKAQGHRRALFKSTAVTMSTGIDFRPTKRRYHKVLGFQAAAGLRPVASRGRLSPHGH